jgi:hypothetical protein
VLKINKLLRLYGKVKVKLSLCLTKHDMKTYPVLKATANVTIHLHEQIKNYSTTKYYLIKWLRIHVYDKIKAEEWKYAQANNFLPSSEMH